MAIEPMYEYRLLMGAQMRHRDFCSKGAGTTKQTQAATLPLIVATLLSGVLLCSATGAGGLQCRLGNAGLHWRDRSGGGEYGQADLAAHPATVLVFSSTSCPCAGGYTERIKHLAQGFGAQDVPLFVVFSGSAETDAAVSSYLASVGAGLRVIQDPRGELAHGLKARVNPTAMMLNARGEVQYRGMVDDSPDGTAVHHAYLQNAVDAVLRHQRVAVRETRAVGCIIPASAEAAKTEERPVKLVPGLGKVHIPITATPAAQRLFDQGVMQWYGFNFDESERSFREAARVDPNCAMARWGLALALGMNYNWDYETGREGEIREALRTASRLAESGTPKEKELIAAMRIRHPEAIPAAEAVAPEQRQKILEAYHSAMEQVYAQYPDDPDIATLYAASGMDLRPWKLWAEDGSAQPGTERILQVLEKALRQSPGHIGARHYHIHALEQSHQPERALESARKLGDLAPNSGHLIHMPSHIFMRVGDYERAASSNRRAADVDEPYIRSDQITGGYTGYYLHTLDFRVAALCMEGRSRDALAAAHELAAKTATHDATRIPRVCGGPSSEWGVWVRFADWDRILKAPAPPETAPMSRVIWHYARGLALVSRKDAAAASRELQLLEQEVPAAEKAVPTPPNSGFTQAFLLGFKIMRCLLVAKIAMAAGETEKAMAFYAEGIRYEDSMPYLEAPGWRHPVREARGAALLSLGRAREAEESFRADLVHNPHSGWALYGLWKSLETQDRKGDARRVYKEYREAWKHADIPSPINL